MDWLTFGLTQEATYWEKTGVDGYNEPTFAAPRRIPCRWEDRVEKIQSDEGVEVISRSRIFVAEDLQHGGYLALGDLTDFPDPRNYPGARRMLGWRKTPSLDGTAFERRAYL